MFKLHLNSFTSKGQIISKGLLVSSNSPNSFVSFLGEFKDTKKSFRNYLIFTIIASFQPDRQTTLTPKRPNTKPYYETATSNEFPLSPMCNCNLIWHGGLAYFYPLMQLEVRKTNLTPCLFQLSSLLGFQSLCQIGQQKFKMVSVLLLPLNLP